MGNTLTRSQAYQVLNGIPHVGPISVKALLASFNDDPARILNTSVADLKRVHGVGEVAAKTLYDWEQHFNLKKDEDSLSARGGQFVDWDNAHYSNFLKEIYDPPIGLYCLGDPSIIGKSVAIVGSRRATLYGIKIAKQLGAELSRLGYCIVSGLARGIDSAAHEGALLAGGKTAAVLGCGLDIIYPPENKDLYSRIAESGVVMSEFPMGRRADKQTFPMRNRIVSGLSQGVIVVETDAKGGSMISARMAAEQGRQVFAVPGRIDQASSRGCHQLIRDGATMVTCVDDIVQELHHWSQLELGFNNSSTSYAEESPAIELTEDERVVITSMKQMGVVDRDGLVDKTQLPPSTVSATLLGLELKQLVVKRAEGTFEAKI